MRWQPVIGLELHVQLATESKLFSAAATRYGAEANTQACAVDLGLPGVLPVINTEALRMAVMFGLAVNAEIAHRSVFARKNYFYPDLPKGYQISQFELPIVRHGELYIDTEDGGRKRIGITRAHLEEDAGKSVHEGFAEYSGIDLNRAGTPLLEIVSEPVLCSAAEAVACMKKIHSLIRCLGISDGNMQEGSLRCDANVSVRQIDDTALGTRTEIKNINSFRFIEHAIDHEIDRQIDQLEAGRAIIQETRLYDPEHDETRPMRGKEEADDYRYFPDPDLLPVIITEAYIGKIRETLPELPEQKKQRFIEAFALSDYDSSALTANKDIADYFEQTMAALNGRPKLAANWIMGELTAALNKDHLDIADSRVSGQALAGLLNRISDNTISSKIAKQVFDAMWQGAGSADAIIQAQGLTQLTDSGAIERLVDEVIAECASQVTQYRCATDDKKAKLIGYFIGQVMRKSQGKADPTQVNALLRQKLAPPA